MSSALVFYAARRASHAYRSSRARTPRALQTLALRLVYCKFLATQGPTGALGLRGEPPRMPCRPGLGRGGQHARREDGRVDARNREPVDRATAQATKSTMAYSTIPADLESEATLLNTPKSKTKSSLLVGGVAVAAFVLSTKTTRSGAASTRTISWPLR